MSPPAKGPRLLYKVLAAIASATAQKTPDGPAAAGITAGTGGILAEI